MVNVRLLALRWAIQLRDRSEAVWETRRPGFSIVFACVLVTACLLWWVPSPGVGVAFMGVAAALMSARTKASGLEKAAWMGMIFALLLVEIMAIRKDRYEHDVAQSRFTNEQREHFSNIGDGMKAAIQQGQQEFQATMAAFGGVAGLQRTTISKLELDRKLLYEQAQLPNLSTKDLAERAVNVATQMEICQQNYVYADSEVELPFWDKFEGGSLKTADARNRLMKEEKVKRGQLRLRYEGNARGIIKSANCIRSEMLRRLLPYQQGLEDGKRKAFFENPVPGETDSVLFKLAHVCGFCGCSCS